MTNLKWFSVWFLVLVLVVPIQAAFITGTVWEVEEGSADTNGGSFVPTQGSCGTDFSKQAAAQIAYTDMVVSGTTFTSALHAVGSTIACNGVQIISGSGCTAGFYYVVSTSGTTGTLDRSAGTGTCTANLGGALGTLGKLNTALNTTDNISSTAWVKANASYNISSIISFNFTSQLVGESTTINGYTSTRGDGGQATIKATATTIMVELAHNNGLTNVTFRNFNLDCNGFGTTGFQFQGNGNSVENLHIQNCVGSQAFYFGTYNSLIARNVWVSNSTTAGFNGGNSGETASGEYCIWCIASGITGTGIGFSLQGSFTCIVCIAAANANDGFSISGVNAGAFVFHNLVGYNNGRDGFRWSGDSGSGNNILHLVNSAFTANAGWGINNIGTAGGPAGYNVYENYNAFYNNTSGQINNLAQGAGDVTLTGNPFTNPGSLNFAPNNTAGAGLALQGVGFPGILQTGGTGAADIGALQHIPAGASAAPLVIPIQ